MSHNLMLPAWVIGFGILLVVVGLWPKRVIFQFRVKPIIARLLYVVAGVLIIVVSFAIVNPLTDLIASGSDKLESTLRNVFGPLGVTLIGGVIVALIVALLVKIRRFQRMRIPLGVQRLPPQRRGKQQLLDLFREEVTLTAEASLEGDQFGAAVAVSNATIVGISRRNVAYAFVRQDLPASSWIQQAELSTVGEATKSYFPCIAINRDRVVVGPEAKGEATSVAYVFGRNGAAWQREAILAVPGGAAKKSVAVNGDTIAIGTYDRVKKAGQVTIFVRDGSNWQEQAHLMTAGGVVALHENTLVVGADQADNRIGVIEVFVRQGTTWQAQAQLRPGDKAPGSGFGKAVAISKDTIVCGAPDHFMTRGAVYVFVRDGVKWKQQALLIPADRLPGTFGYAVAVDGDTIAAGAPLKNGASGVVHIFIRQGESWLENIPLTYSKRERRDNFGTSVGISGNTIIVGVQPSLQYTSVRPDGSTLLTMQGNVVFPANKIPGLVPDTQNTRSGGFAVVFERPSWLLTLSRNP